jgi:hypothetical protein
VENVVDDQRPSDDAAGGSPDPAREIRAAYEAARELRDTAESDAADVRREAEASADLVRSEANRYAAKRLHEVELLVGKAKRSLAAAEERSRLMVEIARGEAEKILLAAREQGRLVASGQQALPLEGDLTIDLRERPAVDPLGTELDRLLADALANALELPRDDPYPRLGPGRVRHGA